MNSTLCTKMLDSRGYANIGSQLSDQECEEFAAAFATDAPFRSHVIMQRHGYGQGEYKYFSYPLPEKIAELRESLYAQLMPIANRWHEQLGTGTHFPKTHAEMLARCHQDGQVRPTPLILKYDQGDFNCLHQDLYGEHVFPLQVVILLTDPTEFDGGEFVLIEQRPRRQSRAEVVPLRKGCGIVFVVNERPMQGTRGFYRVTMRHGVSEVRSGQRHTLGIIFHDAK